MSRIENKISRVIFIDIRILSFLFIKEFTGHQGVFVPAIWFRYDLMVNY